MQNKPRRLAAVTAMMLVLSACAVGSPESGVAPPSQTGDVLVAEVATDQIVATDVVSATEEGSPAASRGPMEQPLVFPADGVTAMAPGLSGGSYGGGIPIAAIAEAADVGLGVTVVDIRPAILNTASGEWDPPPDRTAAQLHDDFALLMPYTVVAMRVDEVLGVRSSSPEVKVGDVIEVWFLGGSKAVTVSKEQALAIGLDGEVDPAAEDKAAAEGSVAEPAEVTGDLALSVEMAYSVYFEEGDSLIFFGRMAPRPTNSTTPLTDPVMWSLVPQGAGVFITDASGQLTAATTSRRGADITELFDIARSLAEATELSQPVGFDGS